MINNQIVLITSGQPALNPRLVKEADALSAFGYQVTVIYQYWNHWGTEIDQQILPQKKWKAIRVGGSPNQNNLLYWVTRIQYKVAKLLVKCVGFNYGFAERTASRCSFLLLKEALQQPASLYIAHNLAALPTAVLAAKKMRAKSGFDAEDFHRNEVSDDPNNPDVLLKSFLEEKYIPQTNYLTASSLPIKNLYQSVFPKRKIVTVLNVFSIAKEVQAPFIKTNKTLKLFWFSQTIGLNRGLQDVLSALKVLEKEQIDLHLLGFLTDKTSIKLDHVITSLQFEKKPNIFFHKQINPDELPVFAAQFDVGLALEPGFCINNNAALSNKIFTYLQAGLAIVVSDTLAQKQFIAANSALGFCYEKGNRQQLASILKQLIVEPTLLQKTKFAAYQAARENLNWEFESKKFLNLVNETLKS